LAVVCCDADRFRAFFAARKKPHATQRTFEDSELHPDTSNSPTRAPEKISKAIPGPCSIDGMTRRKEFQRRIFIVNGTFVCFVLAGVVAVLLGFLSVKVWSLVLLIGMISMTVVNVALVLRTSDRS
jgi:hypothetical protein